MTGGGAAPAEATAFVWSASRTSTPSTALDGRPQPREPALGINPAARALCLSFVRLSPPPTEHQQHPARIPRIPSPRAQPQAQPRCYRRRCSPRLPASRHAGRVLCQNDLGVSALPAATCPVFLRSDLCLGGRCFVSGGPPSFTLSCLPRKSFSRYARPSQGYRVVTILLQIRKLNLV